jgi:putative NADH-flavin reductase
MIAMKLTVFGATGRTGRELVRQALGRGHDVRAVVRDPAGLPLRNPRLTVDVADVRDPRSVLPSVADADAVLSALGPRRGGPATIMADGALAVSQAMKAAGVRRIVAVSAAPVPPPTELDPVLYRRVVRPLLWRFFGDAYRGLMEMERVLIDSGLDWTALRPPYLTSAPRDGRYRLSLEEDERATGAVSRANLADAMLRCLDEPDTIGRFVAVMK